MNFLDIIKDLEFQNKLERAKFLENFFLIHQIPFLKQEFLLKKKNGINYIVNLNGVSNKKIIIGAHYDIWPKSGGANDNGSGVSILLRLIQHFSSFPNLQYSLVFVLFDFEEKGMLGSKYFAQNIEKSDILGMVNLDMCGIGNTLVFNSKFINTPLFTNASTHVCITKSWEYQTLLSLPPSDNLQFSKNGIESLSIAIVPEESFSLLSRFAQFTTKATPFLQKLKIAIPLMIDMIKEPPLFGTMHSKKDTINTLSEESLKRVYEFAQNIIMELVF